MFCIKVADLVVEIDNQYDDLEKRCEDYLVAPEGEPDIRVVSSNELLQSILRKYSEIDWKHYSMRVAEFFHLHEGIYPQLPQHGAAWMHACLVEVDGEGYAFTAPSGYGKTTQALLWLDYFGERARIVNGDNPILHFKNGDCYACGTPFGGSEGFQCNAQVPLKGVCFLNHSHENHIERMDPSMVFIQILRAYQQYELVSEDNLAEVMDVWERIAECVPFWQLYCNRSPEAVEVAYRGMRAAAEGARLDAMVLPCG